MSALPVSLCRTRGGGVWDGSPEEGRCWEGFDNSKGDRDRSAKQGQARPFAHENPDAALGADPCVERSLPDPVQPKMSACSALWTWEAVLPDSG